MPRKPIKSKPPLKIKQRIKNHNRSQFNMDIKSSNHNRKSIRSTDPIQSIIAPSLLYPLPNNYNFTSYPIPFSLNSHCLVQSNQPNFSSANEERTENFFSLFNYKIKNLIM